MLGWNTLVFIHIALLLRACAQIPPQSFNYHTPLYNRIRKPHSSPTSRGNFEERSNMYPPAKGPTQYWTQGLLVDPELRFVTIQIYLRKPFVQYSSEHPSVHTYSTPSVRPRSKITKSYSPSPPGAITPPTLHPREHPEDPWPGGEYGRKVLTTQPPLDRSTGSLPRRRPLWTRTCGESEKIHSPARTLQPKRKHVPKTKLLCPSQARKSQPKDGPSIKNQGP